MNNNVQIIISALDHTGQALGSVESGLKRLTGTVTSLAIQFQAVTGAARSFWDGIKAAIQPAYMAVEDFNLTVTKTAALLTSFQGNAAAKDLAGTYAQARDYASALALKLEEIDAKTVAGAADLRAMTEEMVKQGLVLDINNARQVAAFTKLANAVAVVSMGYPNKEIQIRQEIRALLMGQLNMHSQLAQQLDAMVGGTLKEKLEQWREEGTLIEHIGELLKGYAAASKDIEGTWAAIGSTMETIQNRILRTGMAQAYQTINAHLQKINEWLKQSDQMIGGALHRSVLAVAGIIETAWNLLQPFTPLILLIAEGWGKIADGLGLVAYVLMPPLAERTSALVSSIVEMVLATGRFAEAIWKVLQMDFAGAADAARQAKDHWDAAGRDVGAVFAEGFGEQLSRRYNQYVQQIAQQTKAVMAPALDQAGPIAKAIAGSDKMISLPGQDEWRRGEASRLEKDYGRSGQNEIVQKQQEQLQYAEQARASHERIMAIIEQGRQRMAQHYAAMSATVGTSIASNSVAMEVSLDRVDQKGQKVRTSLGRKAKMTVDDQISKVLADIGEKFDKLRAKMEKVITVRAEAKMHASSEKPMTEKLEELSGRVTNFGALISGLNPILSIDGSAAGGAITSLQELYIAQVKKVVDAAQLAATVGKETAFGSAVFKQLYQNQEAGARAGLQALNDLLGSRPAVAPAAATGAATVNITINAAGSTNWREIVRGQIVPELRHAGVIP